MTRFLFAVPPLAGHIYPTVAVGQELEHRGHQVAWVGHPRVVARLLPQGCLLLPAGDRLSEADLDRIHGRWLNLRGFAALKVLWEEVLIPIGLAMVAGVRAAVEEFCPDVMVVDQQALAGAVVARNRGLPWATSASTFSELTRPYARVPQVEEWVAGLLESFSITCGMDPGVARRGDLRFSEHLVLAFTTPELAGSVEVACRPVFVGPAIGGRPAQPAFAWDWLDPGSAGSRRRRVLASLGTHNGESGTRFYGVLLEAVGPLAASLQVVLVAPRGAIGPADVPGNVLVCESVPQLSLLGLVDAVVSHAGINTVSESLARGLPLVLAPIRDDQPIVAERVASAGAGVLVRFGRVQPPELRQAIAAVLTNPSYRDAARRLGEGLARAGGARAAADHLEALS